MGELTTHVLDTAAGRPGSGIRYELYRAGPGRELLASGTTDGDGRSPQPLLAGAAFVAGEYELAFDAGAYFEQTGAPVTRPPFLGTVVIRFAVADPGQRYHVPLLLSPYGYATYRGS